VGTVWRFAERGIEPLRYLLNRHKQHHCYGGKIKEWLVVIVLLRCDGLGQHGGMETNVSSRQCAYCGTATSALTREHVFPASLDREFRKDAEKPMASPYWLDRLDEKMVGGQPTVKDVCEICNNVVLSALDSYGVELYRKFFSRIADKGDKVHFQYDYDRLLRWLLKLNYNSARANKAADLESLQKLRLYILDRKPRPKRIALYLTLLHRHEIPEDVKLKAVKHGIPISETNDPDMLRIGHFAITSPEWNPLLSRTAIFQSYFFSFILIGDKEPAQELERLKKTLSQKWPGAVLLQSSQSRVSVQASMPANDSFKTHIWKNQSYYQRKFPAVFDALRDE
jgi:5-methylcytosine-specific restriction endonuclease McrA